MTTKYRAAALVALLALAACENDPTTGDDRFLDGTRSNGEIGIVLNSLERSLTLFQLGDPEERREIAFGASSAVTPVSFSIRGERAAVPLGNAASVALVDLRAQRIDRFFVMPQGNATGSVFADDSTVLAANFLDDYVGRFTAGQAGDAITQTVQVAPAPADIEMASGRALVISANLNASYVPIGNGVVTALNPRTLAVLGTVQTGGTNPNVGAVGPDGLLYVLNTGDYFNPSSVTIIDPATLQAVQTIGGFPAGAGSITIDERGLAYVSGYGFGTVVWNTATRTFVRGPQAALCAPVGPGGGCRGAFEAAADEDGNVYQVFFGAPAQNLPPRIFIYSANTYVLADSLDAGQGPTAIDIREF